MNELIYRLDVLDANEQVITSDVRIRERTIEIWMGGDLVGTTPRGHLRAWLWVPEGSYAYDRVMWFITGGKVGIQIHRYVPGCYLADEVVDMLRSQV